MPQANNSPSQAGGPTVEALDLLDRLKPALDAHDRAATVEIVARLVEIRAPMGKQWQALAQIAARDGELTLARRASDLLVQESEEKETARFEKAGLLAEFGAWQEAHALLKCIPEDTPDAASYAHSRGTSAMFAGDHEEARTYLMQALSLQPRSGATWQSLATLVDFSQDDDLAEQLIRHEAIMQNATPSSRGLYYHALGKLHADREEHRAAYSAFARGAELVRSTSWYDRDRDQRMAEAALEGFDATSIARIAGHQTEETGQTIFVTGMPRSGTTLVEQILTSHTGVCGGGEANRLGLLVKDIQGLSRQALEVHVGKVGAPALARLWKHWMRELFPGSGRTVDKTNNTSRMMGIAASLLPEAPIIWLTRDPLDCAWSCLRTHFLSGNAWSYEQQDIAWHMKLEDRLREHWQCVLEDRLLVVPYGDLVTNPDDWIDRILAHCGLAPEAQTFKPHENRRAVATSSVMQVRRPISSASLGSAQPYSEFLGPFQKAYFG